MADSKLLPQKRDNDGCIFPVQATEDLLNVTDSMRGISIDNISMATNSNQVTQSNEATGGIQYAFANSAIDFSHIPRRAFEVDSMHRNTRTDSHLHIDTPQPSFPPARHREYAGEFARKQTFILPMEGKQWPHQPEVQDIDNLVRHGMFYTGIADLARCYQCGLGLKDWTREDDALFVHLKYSPTCHHIKRNTDTNLLRMYQRHIETSDGSNNGPPINRSDNPIRHTEYQSKDVRLASFIRWPSERTQTPEMLATAGFFHLGMRDIVRCFACDGGLQNWDSGDEPWIEHARWFPFCSYVLQEKGEDFVNMVRIASASEAQYGDEQAELEDGTNSDVVYPLYSKAAKDVLALGYSKKAVTIAIDECKAKNLGITSETIMNILLDKQEQGETLPEDDQQPRPESPPVPEFDGLSKQSLLQERDYLHNRLMCINCQKNESNILFLPCRHHKMCESCSLDATECILCSETIQHKVKTFLC